jgi:hypothetical protein
MMKWLKAVGILLTWWLVVGTVLGLLVGIATGSELARPASGEIAPEEVVVALAFVGGCIHAVWYLVATDRKERASR